MLPLFTAVSTSIEIWAISNITEQVDDLITDTKSPEEVNAVKQMVTAKNSNAFRKGTEALFNAKRNLKDSQK